MLQSLLTKMLKIFPCYAHINAANYYAQNYDA